MRCIRCGLIKSGRHNPTFVCNDCQQFSPVVLAIWDDVNTKLDSLKEIDPQTTPIFRLLADTTFITATNPQTRIFYRVCETMIEEVVRGASEMTDVELARAVRTTRSFADIFRVLSDLGLIRIKNTPYEKIVIFEDKLKRLASQFMMGKPVSEQLTSRLAHSYAGYILLYLLTKVASLSHDSEVRTLPYGQRPQSLWVSLMFLWGRAHEEQTDFMLEDLRSFLAKRGIPSSVSGNLGRSLQAVDGKVVQTMIKAAEPVADDVRLVFEKYVMREFERIRDIERVRT